MTVRALPFVLFVGCTSQNAATSAVHGDARIETRPSDARADASSSGEASAPAHHCAGPGYTSNPADQTLVHVSATVVDEVGNPVPNMLAQACGINVCVNGTTDANGVVAIDTNTSEQKPAFKYGDGKSHAKFALLLDGSPIDVDLGREATVAFDPPANGAPFVSGSTLTSRGVNLELPADMNPVKPDPFDYDTPDLQKFRAALVPIDKSPAAVDASLKLGILVALTPIGAALCPAAKLTVPNTANWPAGSAVEFYLHGVDVAEEWAPYGGWAKVSDGQVAADGKTVSTADGGGLPSLSVVGVRLAP